MARVTLADIARQAGVSPSTVSRALNGSPSIPDATRQRVTALAADMDYRVDERARNFRLQRSGTVAVLFPYQGRSRRQLSDPFYLEIAGAIIEELDPAGCDLLIARVAIDDPHDDWPRRYSIDKRVDGLILIDRPMDDTPLRRLYDLDARFVVWGQHLPGEPYVCVGGNSRAGAGAAVHHLVNSGRRRIAFIGGFQNMAETEFRRQGYVWALTECGLPVDETLLRFTDFSPEGGGAAMTELLEAAPDLDAVFLCSDFMAGAALEVLRRAGRHVPGDVAVIGYDDIPLASYYTPRLTTIHQPIHAGGRLAARKLLALLNGDVMTSETLPVSLIVRESAGG